MRTPLKAHLTVQYCACGFASGVVISNRCKLIFYKDGAYHLFTLGPSIADDYIICSWHVCKSAKLALVSLTCRWHFWWPTTDVIFHAF